MTDSNANNLYLRHGYQAHLREAKGVDPKTIDLVVSAIEDFDISIEHCDYLRLTKAISLEYKTRLSKRASKSSGQPLARGTIVRRLGHIQDYLRWVKTRKGFVGLDQDVIDFLTPSRRLRTSLTTTTELAGPLPAVLEALIRGMPSDTFLERRNRAAIALIYLTGVRDGVIPTLSLRHIDVSSGALEQDGLEVATKFGKTMRTFFFPIPEDIRTVVVDWVRA
jgi:site-specific recombinase XerD